MTKKCKITVETEDGLIFTYEYENVKIDQDKGMEIVYGAGTDIADMHPNGQERVTILAWSGIPSFDQFEQKTIKAV